MKDLNIYTSTPIEGGNYGTINVYGATKANDNIKANELNVFGSANFLADVSIDKVNVLGAARFEGKVEAEALTIKGSSTFFNEVEAKMLEIYGACDLRAKVKRAAMIKIYGSVKVNVLESDRIVIEGMLHCDDQLNADEIEITPTGNGESVIKEMVGSKITVKPRRIWFSKGSRTTVQLIEGDDIALENVEATFVRGNKITIGPNCKIGEIEYFDALTIDKSSTVERQSKV